MLETNRNNCASRDRTGEKSILKATADDCLCVHGLNLIETAEKKIIEETSISFGIQNV